MSWSSECHLKPRQAVHNTGCSQWFADVYRMHSAHVINHRKERLTMIALRMRRRCINRLLINEIWFKRSVHSSSSVFHRMQRHNKATNRRKNRLSTWTTPWSVLHLILVFRAKAAVSYVTSSNDWQTVGDLTCPSCYIVDLLRIRNWATESHEVKVAASILFCAWIWSSFESRRWTHEPHYTITLHSEHFCIQD